MVSIETKFIGPTNSRGSRYKAWVPEDVGRTELDGSPLPVRQITLNADYKLGSEANHYAAARALIAKLEWFGSTTKWFGGGTRTGYVFVCAAEYAELKETV